MGGGIGDRQRLIGDRIDHRQRLEEVVDAIAGHLDGELVLYDRTALEVGDAVAVDDHPPERRVRHLDVATATTTAD